MTIIEQLLKLRFYEDLDNHPMKWITRESIK